MAHRSTALRESLRFQLAVPVALAIGIATAAPLGTPPENAASIYDQIATILYGAPDDPARLLDHDAEVRIATLLEGGPVTDAVRNDLARAREALDLVHLAASMPKHERALDRTDGFGILLPHLSAMRQVARLLMADATVRLADGDADGAAQIFGSTLALSGHVTTDRLLISTLVASAIGSMGSDRLQQAIDLGALDADQARTIINAVERLDPTDPFGYANALDGELEMIRSTIHGYLDADPRFDELADDPDSILGTDEGANPFADQDADELLAELAAAEGLFEEVADAVNDPDPELAKLRIAAIEERIDAGEAGLLRQLLPAFSRIFDAKLRAEANIADPVAQLRTIASGEKTPADFTNAASWLRQAADAARRIDVREQQLIEAVRIAPDAFQGDENEAVRDEIRRILHRHRAAIVEPLLKAAEAGRCRFASEFARRNEIAVGAYVPGVRGALRFFLVDILYRDAPSTVAHGGIGDQRHDEEDGAAAKAPMAQTPAERLAAAVRVIELIAGDASLAHAMLATTMFEDLSATTAAILARTEQTAEAIAVLREAIERIDRTDPFGHRRGLEADRALLIRYFGCDDPGRTKRRDLAGRLNANQTFAVALALHAHAVTLHVRPVVVDDSGTVIHMREMHDPDAIAAEHPPCSFLSGGPLLSLRDVFDAEACAATFARRGDVATTAPVLRAGRDTPDNVRDPLGGITLPTVVDLTQIAHRAGTLIDELDTLVRRFAQREAPN